MANMHSKRKFALDIQYLFLRQVAASGVPSSVVLTDGNVISVNNVKVSLQKNDLPTDTCAR